MRIGNIKLLLTGLVFLLACSNAESQRRGEELPEQHATAIKNYLAPANKINGVNFSAPARAIESGWTADLQHINASWVSLIPFGFSKVDAPGVYYEPERQFWGESIEGIRTNIKQAHEAGLKVMIKPQVWMQRGWIGDFDLHTEEDWKIWENDYEKYIMHFAKLGALENAEMICLGTEYRNAVKKRPEFWARLATDIRKIYKGKLTYCANWDDYPDVKFWKSLDYVGISSYYPLSEAQTPTVAELEKAWKPIKAQLKTFSEKQQKPILFTEFGYRSMDQSAWRSWEMEYQERPLNMLAQANAYEALFKTFWKENWFAGGFAWKWYSSFHRMDPKNNHDWTPQNKKAQEIMKIYFGK
ncbi:MAG: hypothetical protein ABIP95_06660 [Pelobium sp.]